MKLRKIIILLIVLLILICITNKTQAMSYYQNVGTTTGLVTASALNVRQGPGTIYKSVTLIYKNEYIRIFAQIGDWYVVQTNSDFIGCVSKSYVKLIYPQKNTPESSNNGIASGTTTKNSNNLTADEQEVFKLINEQRVKNGLTALIIDNELQNVARVKAKDMIENNYFSHNSPTYGTPFEMIKKYGISYKTAGENIAGNSNNVKAVDAWMNSSGHRANILNNSFNFTGIGVVQSPKYGKIYVQMFIGK